MPYADRAFTCRCGTEFRKRAPAGSDQRCIMCSIEGMAASIGQMHAKSGPAWDAWCQKVHQLIGCPAAHLPRQLLDSMVQLQAAQEGNRGTPSPGS